MSTMHQAALIVVRRGWAVFPCREEAASLTVSGKERTYGAKSPYGGKGLKDATRDEQRVNSWWKQHPGAVIGVALGDPACGTGGIFVVDFDPRTEEVTDSETGEVTATRDFTLAEMKAELEAQIGVPLPPTLTSRTPSGGVHLWFRMPKGDKGEAPGNRGCLPRHVDVRGKGGYVVVPPSKLAADAEGNRPEYRWIDRAGDWRDDAAIAEAPANLITILRAPKGSRFENGVLVTERPAPLPTSGATSSRPSANGKEHDAVRKYALSALDGECRAIRQAGSGTRNAQLNESAFKVATLVAAGAIDAGVARASIEAAARENPGRDDAGQLEATIDSGWTAGLKEPRDLREVAASSSRRSPGGSARATRDPPARDSASPHAPDYDEDGQPSSHGGGSPSEDVGKGSGGERGSGADADLTRECAFLPHTDLGNLQRFLRRYGRNFLYVEQWGWLAWDGARWNRDMAVSLLGRAVQDTMRAIQEEAALIADSGMPETALEMWDEEQKRAHAVQQRGKFDRVVMTKGNKVTLFSETIAKWGRTSEGAGHMACIAKLAEARLSARPQDFDADPLLLNVENGTLEFHRGEDSDLQAKARAVMRSHRRRDRITKIANVAFDEKATCDQFDKFLGHVQPDPEMRTFLDVWSGYNSLGLADAQKMAVFYGTGSNGKGVWINTVAHVLGDYAWAAGIETFIDQGKYRKGSDASPDLAALAGRRMVYANEPEEGSKFSDGLIKSMTSDEPIGGVRELMKPPFQLDVTFTNTVSANHRPKIGTDHGIQRRVQVVPWDVTITDAEVDPLLKAKLKAEASGVLNRMVRGALAYLDDGLPMPEAIREATREYQEENDILGQFLALVIEPRPGDTMGSSELSTLFAAWQTWAQLLPASGKPWSAKYLNAQLQKKGYKIRKSSTMRWLDIGALFDASDFVDEGGKPVTRDLPTVARRSADAPPAPPGDDDYDAFERP